MKKYLIFFLALFFINFIFAQNISITYPSEINTREEFDFNLKLIDFPEGNYDVKIDIVGGETRVAKILNDGQWKSTYYYLVNSIASNEEKDFQLIIEDYLGVSNIEIKIRKTGTNVVQTFTGYTIESIESPSGNNNQNQSQTDPEPEEEKDEEIEEKIKLDKSLNETPIKKEANLTPISLNPKSIKTSDSTKSSGETDYSKYSLVVFCVLLLFLYVIKPKNKKNEFKT
ncbi:hypothetical protein COU58_00810 [Candidatus Pacearchaeota archaeon CG10_big_fil_rev_8_21_14_0_10_32_42]|nr:MAG: hypothetical protein COU58_00810 [Candidatus Pacearchaeota archaeon CG10_big_fil_rev_8_21_14_0_10_32_42]